MRFYAFLRSIQKEVDDLMCLLQRSMIIQLSQQERLSLFLHFVCFLQLLFDRLHLSVLRIQEVLTVCIVFFVMLFGPKQLALQVFNLSVQLLFFVRCNDNLFIQKSHFLIYGSLRSIPVLEL